MLKTIAKSANKKLGGCAATYRAGTNSVYDTCPSSCVMKPRTEQGSSRINQEYLQAVVEAVPRDGIAWTYSHFPKEHLPITVDRSETCINISTDSVGEMVSSFELGYPTVIVVSAKNIEKVDRLNQGTDQEIRIVRCPAEYSSLTCNNCGGDTPLCARSERSFVIKFTAHGTQRRIITLRNEHPDSPKILGGCYGNSGPTRLQWEKTKGSIENDAETLQSFVSSLPAGTKLRHHVVGDFG